MKQIDRIMLIFAEARATKGADCIVESAFRKAVESIAERSEADVEELADMMDGALHYNNFLTKKEAERLSARLRNFDGTESRRWEAGQLFDKLSSLDLHAEKEGHYNKWALFYTMNLVSSDQGKNLQKWSAGDDVIYTTMCYDLSVAKLSDFDKPKFVRWHAGIE